MRKILALIGMVVSLYGAAQTPEALAQMDQSKWIEDIDYLNTIIQKQFATFTPEVKPEFEKRLDELKENINSYDNIQIAIKLSEVVAGLKDGHTELQINQPDIGLRRLPLILYFFEEGLYLAGSHAEYKRYIGYKVTRIGDKPVKEVVPMLKELMTHDNEYEILHAGPGFIILPAVLNYLGVTESYEEATLTMQDPNNSNHAVKVTSKAYEDYLKGPWFRYAEVNNITEPLSRTPNPQYHWYKYIEEENAMYFYYGRVNNQKGYPKLKNIFKELFDEIDEKRPDKLIIDMRRNTGGNYHKSRPLIDEIAKRPWLNQQGRIYAISGRTTFSAAMVTCIFLKMETNATLIGEPSRGHPNKTDNVEYLNLPNSNLRLEYTTKVLKHWPELGDSNLVPVDVDIPVKFSDYSAGKDAALEYVFGQVNSISVQR